MTENKGTYTATEAERIANLPRDELIYQVDGETGSVQELIEQLADLVLAYRGRVIRLEKSAEELQDDVDMWFSAWEAAHEMLATARRWAKAWKRAATVNRKRWQFKIRCLGR